MSAHILCPTCLRYWRPEGLLLLPSPFGSWGEIWTPQRHAIATDPWVASLFGIPSPRPQQLEREELTYMRYESGPVRIRIDPPAWVSHRIG